MRKIIFIMVLTLLFVFTGFLDLFADDSNCDMWTFYGRDWFPWGCGGAKIFLRLGCDSMYTDTLEVNDTAYIKKLNVDIQHGDTIYAETLYAVYGEIDTLGVHTLTVTALTADSIYVHDLVAETLYSDSGFVRTLLFDIGRGDTLIISDSAYVLQLVSSYIYSDTIYSDTLYSAKAEIDTLASAGWGFIDSFVCNIAVGDTGVFDTFDVTWLTGDSAYYWWIEFNNGAHLSNDSTDTFDITETVIQLNGIVDFAGNGTERLTSINSGGGAGYITTNQNWNWQGHVIDSLCGINPFSDTLHIYACTTIVGIMEITEIYFPVSGGTITANTGDSIYFNEIYVAADTMVGYLLGNASTADSANWADSALHADSARWAWYCDSAWNADSADWADTAQFSWEADSANWGDSSYWAWDADSANHADSASWADSVLYSDSGLYVDSAGYSDSSGYADTAHYSDSSLWADTSHYCDTCTYADSGLFADTARYADSAYYVGPSPVDSALAVRGVERVLQGWKGDTTCAVTPCFWIARSGMTSNDHPFVTATWCSDSTGLYINSVTTDSFQVCTCDSASWNGQTIHWIVVED